MMHIRFRDERGNSIRHCNSGGKSVIDSTTASALGISVHILFGDSTTTSFSLFSATLSVTSVKFTVSAMADVTIRPICLRILNFCREHIISEPLGGPGVMILMA